MKAVRVLVVLVLALALFGGMSCKKSQKDQLIGKWKPESATEGFNHIEFTKDGKVKLSAEGMEMSIDYELVDDDTFKMKGPEGDEQTVDFKIEGDTMTTTDKDGKVEKFTRVK